ncbi:TonB-dependent siderophore receptor [Paucibacter sp. R3-3]|uniref:TonB-dependent siderophore receptor n=1 Tax=Roseateles agri TaxID=3098619 RepID=A0ABU5DCG6_9BURK|nr:TonB-dependent siderophore receptor [Paucibacter sp. R3-3]MDY0743963.1 TonB-dependent siderophore receptor [Paucibacter sp. R3-3]
MNPIRPPHTSFPTRPTSTAVQALIAVAAFAHLAPAAAQTAPAAPDNKTLPTVRVSADAENDKYTVKSISSAVKTDTALLDTPQTVTVITEALIKDQAMQSMADVTRYVPGIGMANGEGNRDSPVFRGSNSASGDFYIDGVRDDVEYYRDLYNVERVEALTGPNAMIFGRGGSGGVINRVTKQANWRTVRAADLTLGSYKNRRLTADVGQALNDTVAFRVTGMAEDSGGYQRDFSLKRSGINPTVAIRADRNTSIVLGFEHFNDERTTDRGIPSRNGRPLDLPVDAFFGDPNPDGRQTRLKSNAVTGVIDHDFGGGVHLTNKTRYTDYDKFYQNYNAGAVNAAGTLVPISAYNNHQWRKNFFNQTDVTFDVVSGSVKHKILVGMELGQQDTDYLRMTGKFNNGTVTSINVPLATPDGPLPTTYVLGGSTADRDGKSKAKIAGFYAQDQIELSPQWQLIAGLRYDSFKLSYHNNVTTGILAPTATAPANLSSDDKLLSPRAGVLFKAMPSLSLYANYSIASFPRGGDQLSSLTNVNQGLKPEKFVNTEFGAKWEIKPDLLATLAVYKLDRKNVAVTNPATGIADQLVDGARTYGVELGIGGNVTRDWSINGGYAYQDAKLKATASATALAGATVQNVPRNTFSLWNRYDFNSSLGAGLGVIRRGDSFTSTSNAVVLPAYTRVDAALFYAINTNYKVQLNVENLTDKKYYAVANGDNNITPGSPRAFKVMMSVKY